MNKVFKISLIAIPIVVMVALIPLIQNDYSLALVYLVICAFLLLPKRKRSEIIVFLFGLLTMTVSEYFFLKTGVEVFIRNSLFGIMPVWLPILWAYGFVAIKKALEILNND